MTDQSAVVTGAHVIAFGDPSVGIPEAHWSIDGEFVFDGDREEQREILRSAFSKIADGGVQVLFSDEIGDEEVL